MIKVNTFKKRSDELYANRPKNQGGLLGGAEFAAKSLAAGVGSIGEGVVDIFGAAGNLIVGDVEGAKDMFRNNVVGDWYAAEREKYNPDGVMSFVGDTLHGIGQSAVLFIPYAGAPLFYAGIVSQGVSSAAAKTGEVGLKELAYGGTMGALEGVIDKALGGTASTISNAVKGIGKNAGKSTGKALFKATTNASRKGLMRKTLSSAASEFVEEFASEYADTFVQRAYRIDPTKQYSLKDAVYSGFVGMTSGMVTTSAVEIPRSINYAKKGRSIIDRGNSQTLVNTATVVADKLANKGTNFKNAAGWVTALRGQVDAYNDLVKKGKGDSASAATILGEMQAYLSYAETKAVHAGLMEKIEKASDEDKAALAEYINMLVDKKNRKKDYTAEDITNNTDEIASQLAIMQFAGMALDYESITEDVMREQEISETIANERNTFTEETPATTVEDAPFAEAMSKAEETPAQVAETVETGQTVDTESAPAPAKTAADIKRGVKNATNKIEVQGKLYEISEANIDDISNRAENLIKSGVSETDAVAQAIDEGLSDIRSLDEGGKLSPVFAKARIAKIKGAIINAYRQGVQNEAKKAAREAKLAEDTETHKTEETATEEKNVPEAETKTEAPNTSNYIKIKGAIVPNKSAQATKTKEAPKQQNAKVEEKSSDSANKSTESKKEPPKVTEPKESLTDEQRAERARKKAEEMLKWELNNTPTVNELNTAREYVKGFDNLSPERRQSIIRMMRTAKGVDVKTVKGIANLMAIKAGADLDLRFDEEVSEYGASVKSEGRTLIIISSKTDFKNTVEGTVAHELVHYLENKPGYEAFVKHVLKRVKPEKKKEVEDQVTKQYNERYEQIYRKEYTKQGLKGAELNKAVKDALESAQHKAMIDSEVVAELVGQALNSDKFLSRYARIGNTDGFIKKAYTFLRAMVKELKSEDKENNELADIIMPTIKSMDRLLQMDNTNENVEWKVQYFASNKKNAENDSIKTQLRDHLDEVNAMDPVANIDFDPNSVTDNIIAKSVAWDEYQKIGKQVDRQNFGIILIGKDELGGAMAYVHTPAERAALLAVPKVLKRGKIISGHENHKENGFPSITIAGPVTINGVRGNVAVVVQQQGKNKYHAHRILMPDGSVFVIKNKDAEPSTASMSSDETRQRLPNGSASKHSIHFPEQNVNTSAQKNAEYLKESQTNAKEAVFGKSGEAEKIPASRVVQSTVKYSLAKAGELAENTTKYNNKHGATDPSALKRGIDTMKRMASLMKLYLDKPGVLPPDVIGKTAWKNGSYGRTMENTTLCIRTLTYEYFKDEVAKAIGRPLTVSESLLASQKIYDIATYPQCIYCYVAADRKSYDAFIGEYVADMDKYIKLLKKGGDSNALYEEYLHGRKSTKVQEKRWAEWKRIAKSGESYIKASDINTRSKRNELVNKGGKTAAQVKDAMRYAQSASWAKSVSDYVAYNGDILKFSDKMIDMLNSEYGLRMYSFSDYTPAFIVENMQMVLDAAARGLKVLSYTKDADYVRIFGKSGMAINMSCFAKYDSKSGTYVEDSRQGMKWDEVKELRAKYKNAGAVMVVTNDKMLEWALKQDWIDVVIPYHIVKTGTTIAGAYEWRNYTRESADYSDGKTANIYPVEHNNDFKTFRKLAEQRGITPRFKEWYDKAVSGEISGDLYMKLVNEVRLPANKLSPVQPNFDLQAAMDSFGVDASGNAIKGGYVDLGGYMGNWFKKGVDVEQEVKTVAEDIQSGKTVSDVTYGRQSVREVPKIQKQYSLAPKESHTNANKTGKKQNAELDEKGEVIDPYFENAYLRSNLAEAEKRLNALLEEMQNMQMRIDYLEGQNEEYTEGGSNLATLLKEAHEQKQGYEFIIADLKGKIRQKDKDLKNERRKTKYQKDIKENYAEQLKHEEEKYLKLLEEGTKQKNFDFIEIFELRARLRELGYDFEAERKKAERLLEQNDKQKEMIKEGKKEIRMAQAIVEVRTREAARLAKELAKRREEFGKYYSATPIKREVMNIVERGDVSKLFGGTYTPTIEGVSANDIAEYIAINLNIKGDDGKVANNIVRVAAENLIQKIKFIDSESGEVKYLENIVDADTYKLFVAAAEGEIAEMIKNAGTVNPYSKLVRDYEKKIAQYVKEEEQSKERKAYGEQLPKTYQEALKMRKLEKRGAAGFSENIEALAKKFAGLVDESGHLHLSRIDDAMNVLSEFIAKEELKNADERTRLKIDDAETMTDFASDDAMLALLKALVENYKHNRLGTNPSQMQTAEDLKNVEEIIKVLRKYVEEYGKEYFNGHYVDSVALADQAVKNAFEVSKGRAYKTKVGELLGTNLKKLGNAYFYRILTPETVIESLEGFEKDAVLTKLYHQIRVASDKRNTMAMRMTKPFVEFFESKEHRWQDKGLPMSYDQKLRKKMISINGTDIRLDDAIYLYCLTKDPDSYVGLAENGFITYNEDGQREHTIKIEDIERTRSNIANQFDDVDVEFVKLVEGFFNGTATKIKYDADVKIFGVSNNRDTYYIPIYRYKYARMRNVADARASIAETITVFNKSFTHNRVANNTAIESSGIANIIYTHANSLADYSELYLPLKAFDRIYNRAVPLENGEIRSARDVMNNQVWKGTDQFLQDLFKDIQGQGERRDNALENAVGAIRGFWVSSVLGANLKVCTTQLTSLVSATQVIDPKYITMASPKVVTPDKALGERADKYSDIIEERSFDNEAMKAQGNLQRIGKIGEFTGMGIDFVDRRVCLTIFHAAELQVQDQKGFAVGTEENARLAAKLADETIRTTQSMSDAAEKSALQRSKSEIGKLFSMFTSDTVKNLSHAYGNVMKYMAHKRRAAADPDGTIYQEMLKKDAKDLRRSARTLLMTGVMLGLIAQGFKWLYDELEDDPEERQKDFAMDIASSTLNIFPVASDFIDKLVLGYDMSLNVLDVANDTIDAIKNGAGVISRSMSGEYVSEDEIKRAASNAGTRLISFFGIPIEPARRTVTGLIRRVSPETIYGYDVMRYGASYSADIQAAIESGDEALAEAVIKQLYQDEASGTYTVPELEEIVRLYTLTDEEGNHYNVLPKRTLKKMDDDTELNAAQRKQFNSIYSQASAKVNELIRSEEYKMLDDKAKAKAIRDTYELYYNRAAAEVVGKEWSANQAYSKLTDNYTVLMASKAYKSSLEAYKTDSGKEVTVKEQFSQYVKNLNLSDNDYLIVAYANGYKGKKTTRALLKYINSLDLNEAEKQQIAKALNFDLKNGQFTEKED